MPSNLGDRKATGVLATGVGELINRVWPIGWLVRFSTQVLPADMDFEVYHASLTGPGGYVTVFIDDKQYGIAKNGAVAEYAPNIPMYVKKGQEISFHWSIASGTAPAVWIYLREPEVGRI